MSIVGLLVAAACANPEQAEVPAGNTYAIDTTQAPPTPEATTSPSNTEATTQASASTATATSTTVGSATSSTTTLPTTATAPTTTSTTEATSGNTVTMVLENFAIVPASVTINVGDTVKWVVESGTHTSTSAEGIWNSGSLSVGGNFEWTFTEPGTYRMFCGFHPDSMAATVIVEA